MDQTDRARLDTYFQQIAQRFPIPHEITSLVITHLLPERPAFLGALAAATRIAAVLPKPRSIDQATLEVVRAVHPVHELSRKRFADPVTALHFLRTLPLTSRWSCWTSEATSPTASTPWPRSFRAVSSASSRTPRTATSGTPLSTNCPVQSCRWPDLR